MKINKQQIDIIVNGMMKEIYNPNAYKEEAEKEAQKYLKNFKKSKFYKELEQAFKMPLISEIKLPNNWMYIACPELFNVDYFEGNYYSNIKDINELDYRFISRVANKIQKKLPDEYKIRDELVLRLTIESLGAEDIYEVLNNIKASVKKDFNL